jgi:hypothetical protein
VLRLEASSKVTKVTVRRLERPATGSRAPTTAADAAARVRFVDAAGVRILPPHCAPGLERAALGTGRDGE